MKEETDKDIDKSLVGKYVCFSKQNGSFTWGLIIDQGYINTMKGETKVLILQEQLTCRVAENALELRSLQGISHRIEQGKAGPSYLYGKDTLCLPDYQRSGSQALLEIIHEEKSVLPVKTEAKNVKLSTNEIQSVVPILGQELGFHKSEGLPLYQQIGHMDSPKDGHPVDFALRRFGYRTIVWESSLNFITDIIDPEDKVFKGLSEEQMFKTAMLRKNINPVKSIKQKKRHRLLL